MIPSSILVLSEVKKSKELTTGNCGRTEGTTALGLHLMPRLRPVLAFCQPQWSRSRESGDYHGNTGYREMVFEMQRRLDLWSFSWLSRRSREDQNQLSLPSWTGRSITVPIPAGNFERALGRHFSSIFKPNISLERSFPDLNEHGLFCESDEK